MAKRGLSTESKTRGGVSYVRLAGAVDDTFDPAALVETIRGKDAVVSLEEVTEIGAGCSRTWVETLESLAGKLDRLVLVDCSRVMVTELNLAPRLAEKAIVASVKVRHLCRNCSTIARITYDLGPTAEAPRSGATSKCRRCGGTMAVDENLESYFAFRRNGKPRPADAGALEMAAQLARVLGERADATRGEASAPAAPAMEVASAATRSSKGPRAILVISGAVVLVAAVVVSLLVTRARPTASTVAEGYRARIDATKNELRSETCGRVLRAFQDGKYADIIALVAGVEPAELCDANVTFAVGESYRFMQRLPDGARYYQAIIDAPSSGAHLDDALFWRAESLLLLGKPEEAAALFERITKLRKSVFDVSAKRRLKAIRDGSWTKAGDEPAAAAPK